MSDGPDERMRRWRLALGGADGTGIELSGDDAEIDAALGVLYDTGSGDGSGPGAGAGDGIGPGDGDGPGDGRRRRSR